MTFLDPTGLWGKKNGSGGESKGGIFRKKDTQNPTSTPNITGNPGANTPTPQAPKVDAKAPNITTNNNLFGEEKQNNYDISDPNEVNGLFMGEEKKYYLFIVVELSSKKNNRNATKGVLSVYCLSEHSKKYDTGNIGEKVLEVPIVSGGKEKINGKDVYYEPVAKGYYKNVKKQISGLDSGNQLLWNDAHGGSQNVILRLYKDFLIHQGKNTATQEGSYTHGCIGVTAYKINKDSKGKTDVDRNYEQFRNLIWGGLDVDVEIK